MQLFNNEQYLNLYFKEQNHFAKAAKVENMHRTDLTLIIFEPPLLSPFTLQYQSKYFNSVTK